MVVVAKDFIVTPRWVDARALDDYSSKVLKGKTSKLFYSAYMRRLI